jgi:DNA transformation protein
MPADQRLLAWVAEAMAPVGTVMHRAMMGGATLYCDGTVFAIVDGDGLWFKADKRSDAAWDAIGAERFSYDRGGQAATMNYRRAPDAVYDDGDALRHLAGLALAAGARAPVRKRCG